MKKEYLILAAVALAALAGGVWLRGFTDGKGYTTATP